MTYEEARIIARRHLDQQPFPDSDYRWRVPEGREVHDGWYFDYSFEPIRPIPEAEQIRVGGAPGFLVLRDEAEVQVMSWAEYSERGLSRPRDVDLPARVFFLEVRRTESISVTDAVRWLRDPPNAGAAQLHTGELYAHLKEREWIRLPGRVVANADVVTAARAGGFEVRLEPAGYEAHGQRSSDG
jgi:hypothetical protein